MKDVRDRRDDEDRENVTNGDDHKGTWYNWATYNTSVHNINNPTLGMESPVPAHDELDTAE